ncbi:MAG: replication-relaxation family protein [Solirubrobacteraceae bacterium]
MPAGAASPRADDALVAALAAHVTDRDRAICEALYEHRVLTATQLAQLHFNSLERGRKRLTLLHQLGVLDRFRPHRAQGSHPYHYLLDRLGAQLVAAERGLDLADLDWTRAKTLRLAGSAQLQHLVEASGFFTRFAHALRRAPDGALLSWSGQRRCAQRWGDLVRPDGHARLALPAGRLDVWLEWDRATEPHARLRDKLDRYDELALALDQPLTLLFVAPGERRERHILHGLQPADDVRVLTTTAERHHADPLARNWLAAGAERRVALAELATTSAAPGLRPGRERPPLSGSSAGPQRPELTITDRDEPPT